MTDANAARVKAAMETLEQMANLPCADMAVWDAHANAVQSLAAEVTALTARLKEVEGERDEFQVAGQTMLAYLIWYAHTADFAHPTIGSALGYGKATFRKTTPEMPALTARLKEVEGEPL